MLTNPDKNEHFHHINALGTFLILYFELSVPFQERTAVTVEFLALGGGHNCSCADQYF